MKCRFCNAQMAKSDPKRGWLCGDCRYLCDAAYRERRKACGLKTSGSKTWAAEKRAAWFIENAGSLRAKATVRMRSYRRRPEVAAKVAARRITRSAIERGELTRQPCRCGATRTQAHHHDYAKPLEVEWLCAPCHRTEHAKARVK